MADFDLQQTDQQVQSILNDGQSAMGAGAQTTLTTEYVMLKDVNGVYHKILKDSLTEACRNVLAGLLVNNDKGTTINQIPAIAGGDLGSVTPANLASVLGVIQQVNVSSKGLTGRSITGNDFPTGFYVWDSMDSAPSDTPENSAGMAIVLRRDANSCLIFCTHAQSHKVYFYSSWSNLGSSGWVEI